MKTGNIEFTITAGGRIFKEVYYSKINMDFDLIIETDWFLWQYLIYPINRKCG